MPSKTKIFQSWHKFRNKLRLLALHEAPPGLPLRSSIQPEGRVPSPNSTGMFQIRHVSSNSAIVSSTEHSANNNVHN